MNELQQRYQRSPRQKSPAALDQRILARAHQQATRNAQKKRTLSGWMPVAASAAVACLCLMLVLRPEFNGSEPYAPAGKANTPSVSLSARSTEETLPNAVAEIEVAPSVMPHSDQLPSLSIAESVTEESESLNDTASTELTRRQSASAVAKKSMQHRLNASAEEQLATDTQQQAAPVVNRNRLALNALEPAPDVSAPMPVDGDSFSDSQSVGQSGEDSVGVSVDITNAMPASIQTPSALAWLQSLPADSYVLQLSVGRDQSAMAEELRRAGFDDKSIYYLSQKLREDQGWASLIGPFSGKTAAFERARQISAQGQFEPWVRQVKELQSAQ